MTTSPYLPGTGNATTGLPEAKKRYRVEVGKAKKTLKAAEYPSEARLASAIALWIKTVQDNVDIDALATAIENRNVTEAYMALNLDESMDEVAQGAGLDARATSVQDALQAVYRDGAQSELDRMDKVISKAKLPRVGTRMTFNFLDLSALAHLKTYTFDLIRQITTETRLAIQNTLVRAFQSGGHPYKIAREIRQSIGLTATQSNAVGTYRTALESGNKAQLRDALGRSLRDGRYDKTVLRSLNAAQGLPQAKVDAMVARYRDRSINMRARTIARTETIRASNVGTQAVWDQAVGQDLLDPETTRQIWILSYDERTCPQCKSIGKLNPKGVPLRTAFQSNRGPVMAPPAHPNCRCTVALKFT